VIITKVLRVLPVIPSTCHLGKDYELGIFELCNRLETSITVSPLCWKITETLLVEEQATNYEAK
jgi:hypothetical protein